MQLAFRPAATSLCKVQWQLQTASIAPNPFRETWSKYLSSKCTARQAQLLPCHRQNRANRSNWVRAVRSRQKVPVCKCGWFSVEEFGTQLSLAWSAPATMQSTCFDSSTRATLMPPAVICLWRNQQQFLCSPVHATQRVVYRISKVFARQFA